MVAEVRGNVGCQAQCGLSTVSTCGGVCEIGARPTGVVTQELVTSIHASCFLAEHGLGFGNSSLSL